MRVPIFNEKQELRGGILVAAGLNPFLLRTLAAKLKESKVEDPAGVAVAILAVEVNTYPDGKFLNEKGQYDDEARDRVNEEATKLTDRFVAFEITTTTVEEDFEVFGELGVGHEVRQTPFGEVRVILKG